MITTFRNVATARKTASRLQRCLSCEDRLHTPPDRAPGQPHADRHQDQAKGEGDRKNYERQNSDVRIGGVATDLGRKRQEPRTCRDGRH